MAARKKLKQASKPTQGMAIAGLVLNMIILPGLGSLINERIKEGVYQVVLAVVGIILIVAGAFGLNGLGLGSSIFVSGVVLVIASWIWGLVTGVKLIKEAK